MLWVIAPRPAGIGVLRHDVARGQVTTIEVRGGLPEGSHAAGYAQLTIRWRDGHVTRQVTVREASNLDDAAAQDTDLQVVPAGEVARLRTASPHLRVERVPFADGAGFTLTFLGAELRGWIVWLGLLPFLATFLLLTNGPEPWRATRWAWFWLFAVIPPFGTLAYLVFGGPTHLSPQPRPGARRLTGGWAFLLQLVAGSATVAAVFTA